MLPARKKIIIPFLFACCLIRLNAQVTYDSTQIIYHFTDHYGGGDCFSESTDIRFPKIKCPDRSISQKLNDSIISLLKNYWFSEEIPMDSVLDLTGVYDLSPLPPETDSTNDCDFNSSSVNQIDYRFLMNSGTYLSFFIEFYSEATAAHVSTDHRVAPLLFDMKRKCWINKDSLFYPSVDTLINSITDSLQQEDGYAPFFEGIALQKDTVVFYIGRNWPNHSFTEEYYFNTSALKEYYRDPYCKRFTGHKQKQFPALPEDPD